MRILGIDPGVATTGWGIVDGDSDDAREDRCVAYGVVKTSKDTLHADRLNELHQNITAIIAEYKPQTVAVERLFFCTNLKTAMSVGEARGVLMLAAAEGGVHICEYTPLEVKSSVCGYGKADKKQVQRMVQTLLNMPELPKPDDAADALAVALCARRVKVIADNMSIEG